MKYHLVARPIPIPGESPASVLIRAVDGNGYTGLLMLLRAYWKKEEAGWAKASFVDSARYAEIMEVFGIRLPEDGQPYFMRNGPTTESARLVDGMEIPEGLFREDARYYCPQCLQEHAYWRKLWTLRAYSVCPKHRVYLLRDCHACGGVLQITRGRVVYCDCGADLRKMRSKRSDPSALEWWLNCHMQTLEKGRTVDEILLALAKIDGGENSPQAEYRRLCAVHDWIESAKVAPWLSKLVAHSSSLLHPRIQLLPLLRGTHREAREMARSVLGKWKVHSTSQIIACNDHLRRCYAELALGVSSTQFKRFEELKLLEFPDGRNRERGKVSLAAVNRLLFALQAKGGRKRDSEARGQTVSLASMASDVLSGARKSAGYGVAAGLQSLCLKKQQDILLSSTESEEWIDVNRTAEILCTYPEAVRFLCRKGWIKSSKRFSHNRLMVVRVDVEEFNRKYILGGTYGRLSP